MEEESALSNSEPVAIGVIRLIMLDEEITDVVIIYGVFVIAE